MGPQGPNGNLGPGKSRAIERSCRQLRGEAVSRVLRNDRHVPGAFGLPLDAVRDPIARPVARRSNPLKATRPRAPPRSREDRASRGRAGRPRNGLNTTQIGSS